jgi:hypothetical protein
MWIHTSTWVHTHTHTHTHKDNCLLFPSQFPSWDRGIGDVSTGVRISQKQFLPWLISLPLSRHHGCLRSSRLLFAGAETVRYLIKAQFPYWFRDILAALQGDVSSPSAVFRMQWPPEGIVTGWQPGAPSCHLSCVNGPHAETAETSRPRKETLPIQANKTDSCYINQLALESNCISAFGTSLIYWRKELPIRSHLTSQPNKAWLSSLIWGMSFLTFVSWFLIY